VARRIVVAGSGAVGASVAYHLALLGATDVVVADRGRLCGGSTSRAMGGVRQQFSTPEEVVLARESIAFLASLGGSGRFYFKPSPQDSGSRLWCCPQWEAEMVTFNIWNVTATFESRFDPFRTLLGNAVVFPGTTGNYMRIASGFGLLASNSVSFSMWFKTNGAVVSQEMIATQDANIYPTGASNYDPILYIDNNGKLRLGYFNGDTVTLVSTPNVNDSQWHHAVAVCEIDGPGTNLLYLDGSLIGTDTGTFTGNNRVSTWIGAGYGTSWPGLSGWSFFNGAIDEVRIYNRVLTGAEVTSLYNKSASVTSGQVAYLSMDSVSGTDQSGNGNNFTITGSLSLTAGIV